MKEEVNLRIIECCCGMCRHNCDGGGGYNGETYLGFCPLVRQYVHYHWVCDKFEPRVKNEGDKSK